MENEDNKGMWKSSVRICIGVGVILCGLLAFGIGFTIYLSYKGARVPVYQTTISDFEFQQVSMNDKEYAAHVTSEMNELTEVHGVKKTQMFYLSRKPQPDSLPDHYGWQYHHTQRYRFFRIFA